MKSRVINNFISLSILQGANYILPLITLPYLFRVLGPEKVGLIAFAQAFVAYFTMLTDYGFNLSATKEISIYRNDKEKITDIFCSVMVIKIGLMFISAVVMGLIVVAFKKFQIDWLLYLFSFGVVAGQVLFPVWFFQGLEQMKYITLLNVLAKLIFTLSIFVFVNKTSDYLYVPLINSAGFLVAGVSAFFLAVNKYKISLIKPTYQNILFHFRSGWHIFTSRIFVNLYTSTNIILLGFLTNNVVVGYYSIADKIITALAGLATPFNQSIYPFLAKLHMNSYSHYLNAIKKLLAILLALLIVMSILTYIFSEDIIKLVSGDYYRDSIMILRILAIAVILLPLGTFFTQLIIIQNKTEILARIVFVTSMANIIIVIPLISLLSAVGLAISVVIVQVLVNTMIVTYIYKSVKINYLAEKTNVPST